MPQFSLSASEDRVLNPRKGHADTEAVMKKVLIIEDDPVAGTVYQRFLQANGFATELAADGLKGLEQLSVFQPDAVLLDLMMPKLGGIEVLKRIRADDASRDLPVIVMTNACVPAFIDLATKAGAHMVMDKSNATPDEVLETLQAILRTGAVI